MSSCSSCGATLEVEGQYCHRCGHPVEQIAATQFEQVVGPTEHTPEKLRRRSRRTKVLVALVVLIVVAAGALVATTHRPSTPQVVSYPGTLTTPITKSDLSVIACPSSYGVQFSAGQGPSAVVGQRLQVSIPTSLVGKVSLYSDQYRSIEPILAPSGWKCTVSVGADGGGYLAATPRGSNPEGEQLSYSFVPACSGCAFDVYCPFVSRAMVETANQGTCPMPAITQSDKVDYQTPTLSAGTLFIEDPPRTFGSLTPYDKPPSHSDVTAGYLSYSTINQSTTQLLSCTLPGAEIDICRASWRIGFSDHELVMYSKANTISTTTTTTSTTTTTTVYPSDTYSDTDASFAQFVMNYYRGTLSAGTTIYVELADSDPVWASAKFETNGVNLDFYAYYSSGKWIMDTDEVNVGGYMCPPQMAVNVCEGQWQTENFTYTP